MLTPLPNSDAALESLRTRLAELETCGERLVASENERRLYERLVERSLGLMCSHDLEGRLLLVNPAAAESLGYSPLDGIGQNLRDFLAPEVQPQFDVYLERIRVNSQDSGYMRLRARDGGERVWMYRNVKHEEPGLPPIVLGHALDVTARIKTEQALRESEERFRGLFEDAPIAYHEVSDAGILQRVNRAECELLGWSKEELIGRRISDFVTGTNRTGPNRSVQRYRRKDGQILSLEVHENQIRDASGRTIGVRCALLDIGARLAELERSNTELRQFAYVVSHDLKDPLRQIGAAARQLSEQYHDPDIAQTVEGVDRMSRLIDDLLRYALVASSQTQPARAIDMTGALQTALMNLHAPIQESGAVITHGELPCILADGGGMEQVFQNLVGNAIKYRGVDPPRIDVRAERGNDEFVFAVSDNGIGIRPAHFQRIFGVFERLHGKELPGTGIGLAICKKIVERNGGRIWVESEVGRGSTFYFTAPA